MSNEINWESAFSDDKLDSLSDTFDKAKEAKSKFDEAAEAVSEHLDRDETAETESVDAVVANQAQTSTPTAEQAVAAPTPQVTPPPVAAPTPQATATPNPVIRQAAPVPQAYSAPSPTPPVHSAPAQREEKNDKGGGIPFGKIKGAVLAIVPLLIGAWALFGGGGDGGENPICTEARERLQNSAIGGVVDESLLPSVCQEDAVDETTTTMSTTSTPSTVILPGNFAFPDLKEDTAADGALGSGCNPGDGALPDGVWFGFVNTLSDTSVGFDLACGWSGQRAADEAAARGQQLGAATTYVTNDAPVDRDISIAQDASGWPLISGDNPSSIQFSNFVLALNQTGATFPLPAWVYVNDGELTEIAMANPDALLIATSTPPAPANNCASSEQPQDSVVEVVGIAANDPDEGLNFRAQPNRTSQVLGTFDNGFRFEPTGACVKVASGSVWWQVTGQGITGWANKSFLSGI